MAGKVICICGPTASGKSALADAVALKLESDVISVDAMQVYRGMDIGTAKTPVNERLVPLQMVDVVSPDVDYSVALFQRDARKLVDERLNKGKAPILCGGTGLYLDAIIDEYDFPRGYQTSDARKKYDELVATQGAQAAWDLLCQRDPEGAAAIHPHNTKRVVRALEMLDEGIFYSEQVANLKQRPAHYEAQIWALTMPRELLYERINKRVDRMFEQGLVEEVAGLIDAGLKDALTSHQAIGYKEVLSFLAGEINYDDAVELVKRNTRRYAKRQISWLKRDGRVQWLDMAELSFDDAQALIIEASGYASL